MDKSKLDLILSNHKKWLNGEEDGIKANLRGADLRDGGRRDENGKRLDGLV